MIEKYVSGIADQMGMKLSKVSLIGGKSLGCLDAHSLMMSTKKCNVSVMIHQTDLDNLENKVACDVLELRIQQALLRLRFMADL
jgi:hypothetical protein